MPPNSLRLAYIIEFLLALVAIDELWSQTGGQGHLDLMPWYVKLGFIAGLSFITVAGTAAVVSHDRIWNAKTIACAALALALAGGMGAVTYYYHLHENDEVDSGDETDVAIGYSRMHATARANRILLDERERA